MKTRMRIIGLVAGATVMLVGGGFLGHSFKEADPEVIERPVPGPTETVIKRKRVEVESPPLFSLVPKTTPLEAPSPHTKGPLRKHLVPRGAKLDSIKWVSTAAGVPPQIVVTWRGRGEQPKAIGLLLWQLQESGHKRDVWRVVYGIQEVELGCRKSYSYSDRYYQRRLLRFSCTGHDGIVIGPPGHEKTEKIVCGSVYGLLGFSLHDLTGDGHDDILVAEGGCGSAGTTTWRVLVSSDTETQQIFRRTIGDGGVDAVDGALRVTTAVHGRPREGCSIHGCTDRHRLTIVSWDGTEWQRVASRLVSTSSPYPRLQGSGRSKIYGPKPDQRWGRCAYEAKEISRRRFDEAADAVLQVLPLIYGEARNGKELDLRDATARARRGQGPLKGKKCDGDPSNTASVTVDLPHVDSRRMSAPVFLVSPVWDGWVIWNREIR
jgi:hypothetical protein